MRIWRIENRDGDGPFGVGALSGVPFDVEHRMPGPWDDSGLQRALGGEYIHRWHFGFRSRAQMRSWFSPLLRRGLHQRGFCLVEYEVAEALVGTRQVVFKMTGAHVRHAEVLWDGSNPHATPRMVARNREQEPFRPELW